MSCAHTYYLVLADDLDLELRLARLEHLMDRRPLLLNRSVPLHWFLPGQWC